MYESVSVALFSAVGNLGSLHGGHTAQVGEKNRFGTTPQSSGIK